jgi:hypothetical protein
MAPVVKNVDFSKAAITNDEMSTVADVKITAKKYIDDIDNDDYKILHAWARTHSISFSFKLLDWMIIGHPTDLSPSHGRSNSRYWPSMAFQT